MNENKCCIKNCRDYCVIDHTGNNLCQKHWEEYCDKEYKNINEFLKRKNGSKKSK